MVEILKINPTKPDILSLQKARNLILEGKLVVFPTDTVYGLAADPFNEVAVLNLIKAKQRDPKKGFPILIANLDMAQNLAEFSPTALKLAKRFWPGALTLILPLKKALPNVVTGYRTSLGIRIPSHPIAQQLASQPIIGTSANISGQNSPVTAEDARLQLGDSVDLILDSGSAKMGLPSTIIELTGPDPRIIRHGVLNQDDIKKLII
jgi:L-threonylcarbamoyladenylate synthase